MDDRELKSIIEALLYTWGEPLSLSDISKILEHDTEKIEKLLENMMDEFDYERRGLRVVKTKKTYQLSTRPEHFSWISKLIQKDNRYDLSNAALETLSIIAYQQPTTRNQIEEIRGVRCDRALQTLLEKALIAEKGRLDRPGRPIIYVTTDKFLRSFGLESLEELPSLKKFVDVKTEDLGE